MKINASYKSILRIAGPIMLFNLVQNIIGLTDTIFLGRVGVVELSACGLMSIYYLVMMMIGFGLSRGAQILIARRAGEERYKEIGKVTDHLFILEMLLAGLLFLFLQFGTKSILPLFVQSQEILDAGYQYIFYRSYGIFFSLFGFVLLALYTGIGNTKIVSYITITMAVVNVILNYSLIFGKFGLPEMGIAGAGLASSLAEIVSTIVGVLYVYFDPLRKKVGLFKFEKPDWHILRRLWQLATPLVLQFMVGLGGWFLFFTFIENLGETALAVSVVIKWIYTFFSIPSWGLASAVNTVVSNLIGQGKDLESILSIRRTSLMSFLATALACLSLIFFPDYVANVFTDDVSIIDGAVELIPVLLIILMCCAFATISFNGLMGTGATRVSLLFEAMAIVVYLSYAFFGINHYNFNLQWVWFSEFIYWGMLWITSWLYLNKGDWRSAEI